MSRSSTSCSTACSDSSLAALALSLARVRKYFTTYAETQKHYKRTQEEATHNFKRVKADFSADVSVLVETVLGERAALKIHTELHEQFHDVFVGCRPRLAMLFAVDYVVQAFQGRLFLIHLDKLCGEKSVGSK